MTSDHEPSNPINSRRKQTTAYVRLIMPDPDGRASKGDEITLVRLAGVTKTERAVRLESPKGTIGFLTSEHAKEVVERIDRGERYKGYISNVLGSSTPQAVGVELRFYVADATISGTRTAMVEKAGCLTTIIGLLALAVAGGAFSAIFL